jgi:hypothetical protein
VHKDFGCFLEPDQFRRFELGTLNRRLPSPSTTIWGCKWWRVPGGVLDILRVLFLIEADLN